MYRTKLSFTLLFLSLIVFTGCGGGGGTSGSVSVSAPASVAAGKTFQVTATFTSPRGAQAMPISFTTSDPAIVPGASASTNNSGIATVQLGTINNITADRNVTITAHAGDLTSSTTVLVKANKLAFTAPAKSTATATAGSSVNFFLSGSPLVTYTNGDGDSLGIQNITLRVFNKTGSVSNVLWHDNLTDNTYLATNPRTFTTDSGGNLPNSVVSVVGTAPASGLTSDLNVTLEISVTDPLFGTMIKYGDMTFSITGQ